MYDVGSALRVALWVLGIWFAIALGASLPLIAWFRRQARRNELRTRQERRRAWAAATEGETAR
jgi:hypothetical protein